YLEATADATEAGLLAGLRKLYPGLPAHADLSAVLTTLRRGSPLSTGCKVVLVLDQFEQWLHAHPHPGSSLADALRQCNGGRVQALLLVRDDFWMAISRFMQELELPLREGENSAPVHLFDARHTRKVLAAFGRAFGALPDGPLTAEHNRF